MRKAIIAIDFDGTIVEQDYPRIGALRPNAIGVIQWIYSWADVVIWTCRYEAEGVRDMIEFLKNNKIPYTTINKNPNENLGFCPMPKIYYDVLIDDRNLGGVPRWSEVYMILSKWKKENGF